MAEQAPEQRLIVLSVNAIIEGVFYRAGTALPFANETDLPAAMRPFIATGEEEPFNPAERDLYADLPRDARRQIQRLEAIAAEREAAAEAFNTPLPPETAAVLEAEHAAHIGRLLKQAEVNARLTDDAYKQIAEEAAAKAVQYYVKRGGEWARSQNARLKPGETYFAKRENGEMEAAGVINSRGEPPPPEVTS